MDREAIEDMLETMSIGDSDQRKLRRLLVEQERERQRLKIENEWLKKVLEDCEKKRVDAKSGRVIDMTKPQPCVRYLEQHFNKDKRLYLVGRCLAQVDQERKECLEALVTCFADGEAEAKEHLAEELTDVKTAATTADGDGREGEESAWNTATASRRRSAYWDNTTR